jgi:Peptidase family M23
MMGNCTACGGSRLQSATRFVRAVVREAIALRVRLRPVLMMCARKGAQCLAHCRSGEATAQIAALARQIVPLVVRLRPIVACHTKEATLALLFGGPALRIGAAACIAFAVTLGSYWTHVPGEPVVRSFLERAGFSPQQSTAKSDRLDAYVREERAAGARLDGAGGSDVAVSWPFGDRISTGVQVGPNGERTYGIRISVPVGTPVRAAADGVVDFAGNASDGYGQKIVVKHGAIRTVYGHVSEILVAPKTKVRKGQLIAKSGQSGFAMSPRLYLGLLGADANVDPIAYFAKAGTIDRKVRIPLPEPRPTPPHDIPVAATMRPEIL